MRAITYSDFGSADVLTISDVDEPRIGPDSVLIEVRAVGLNPVDWKARQGLLERSIASHFPVIPAWDVAGVVVKTGPDAPEFEVGDEVFAYARKDVLSDGMLAERATVPVRSLAHKPSALTFEEAAAVPLAGLTALRCVERVRVGEGDRVLIHNGSGGVGGFAIQLARLAGAEVVATASERNHDYLRSLGATPITYGDGLVGRALEAQPDGFDAILDFVGGGALAGNAELMRDGARVVSIAAYKESFALGGSIVWVRPDGERLTELAGLLQEGSLRVEVAEVAEFEQAIDAYRRLEEGHVRGKLVVRV